MTISVRAMYGFAALVLLGVTVLLLAVEMPVLIRNGLGLALLIGLHSVYRWHRNRAVPGARAPSSASRASGEGV